MKRLGPLLSAAAIMVPLQGYAASVKDQLCEGAGGSLADANSNVSNPKCAGNSATLTSHLTNQISTITETLLMVAGAIAVIIIIIGGIRYVTSTGDSARIKAAKDTILYAIIGLVVAILAYAIVAFVGSSL